MSGEPHRLKAVALVVGEAPRSFVFTEEDFVVDLLQMAQGAGNEVYRRVDGALYGSALGGLKTGTAGEPMPADIQLRDRAREARKRWASVPVARAFYEQL